VTLRYLLDTNIVSRLARRIPPPRLVTRLERDEAHCAISAVTVEELRYGALVAPDERREPLLAFVQMIERRFPVLPYDGPAACWAADQREQLRRNLRTIAHPDLCVAATAGSRAMIVVTNNVRHFEVFAGLAVEDWTPEG